MASLNSVLTITFDPDDRALLERVANALEKRGDQPDQLGAVPAPVPDPFKEDDHEPEVDSLPHPQSAATLLDEIGDYLAVRKSSPFSIIEAVKNLGSENQDLRDQVVSLRMERDRFEQMATDNGVIARSAASEMERLRVQLEITTGLPR